MDAGILQCINTRVDFFEKYVTVPAELQQEVADFVCDINALGEQSGDVAEFEAKFAAEGLSDRFNSLVTRCTPIPQEMTAEQKAYSKEVYQEIHPKGEVAKDIFKDLADTACVEAEEELIAVDRRKRIEAGIDDDYTRATNYIDDAQIVGKWLGGLFKKKKK